MDTIYLPPASLAHTVVATLTLDGDAVDAENDFAEYEATIHAKDRPAVKLASVTGTASGSTVTFELTAEQADVGRVPGRRLSLAARSGAVLTGEVTFALRVREDSATASADSRTSAVDWALSTDAPAVGTAGVGPQGPVGPMGDVTPAALAAQAAAEAAQANAETAQAAAETAQAGAETARTGAESAQTAAETARDAASQSAQDAADALAPVQQAGTDALAAIGTAETDALTSVSTAETAALGDIATARAAALSDVEQQEAASEAAVFAQEQASVEAVEDEGTYQAGLVEDEGDTQVALVVSAGDAQVDRVNEAGDAREAAVLALGPGIEGAYPAPFRPYPDPDRYAMRYDGEGKAPVVYDLADGAWRDLAGAEVEGYTVRTAAAGVLRDAHYPIVSGARERTALIEPSGSTNLLSFSEDFSEWASNGLSLTTGYADPEGGTGATRLAASLANSFISLVATGAPTTAGTVYTLSVWLRSDTGESLKLLAYDGVTSYQSPVITPTSEWKRYAFTFTLGAGATSVRGYIGGATSFGVGKSVIAWGAQLEPGGVASSYVKTDGAPATRAGDVLWKPAQAWPLDEPRTLRFRFREPASGSGDAGRTVILIGPDVSDSVWVFTSADRSAVYVGVRSGGAVLGQETAAFTRFQRDAFADGVLTQHGDGTYTVRIEGDGVTLANATLDLGFDPTGISYAGVGLSGHQYASYIPHPREWAAFDVHSGALTLAQAQAAGRGDLVSYRPGDDLTGWTRTRASAGSFTARNPFEPPSGWASDRAYDLRRVYPGGRLRNLAAADGAPALVNGVDDAVGTSDGAPTSAGLAFGAASRLSSVPALGAAWTVLWSEGGATYAQTSAGAEYVDGAAAAHGKALPTPALLQTAGGLSGRTLAAWASADRALSASEAAAEHARLARL